MTEYTTDDQTWPGSNVTGWTCPNCGVWVAFGVPHTCNPYQYAFLPADYSQLLNRIAVALERIAASLEKQRA